MTTGNIQISNCQVGDRIKFAEERGRYTVQARGKRYLVCTKPFNPRRTVLYTIVDVIEGIRGTENLIFCAGFETKKLCEEAIGRLEGAGLDNGTCHTEVSHRNRIPVVIEAITSIGAKP